MERVLFASFVLTLKLFGASGESAISVEEAVKNVMHGQWIDLKKLPPKDELKKLLRTVREDDVSPAIDAMLNLMVLSRGHRLYEEMIIKRASHKDASEIAQHNMGLLYFMGCSDRHPNRLDAFVWWKKAADRGYAQSQYAVGELYEAEGLMAKANRYYQAALNQRHGLAYFKMAVREPANRQAYLTVAAECGVLEAHKELGRYYFEIKDYDNSLTHYQVTAEKGDSESQFWTGYLYEKHRHDFTNAEQFYSLAATKNLSEANYRIGRMNEKGMHHEQDIDFAKTCYLTAASAGHLKAKYRQAYIYEQENRPFFNVLNLYAQAAEAGERNSQFRMGRYCEEVYGEMQLAAAHYLRAARQNHVRACYKMGMFFLEGKGVTANQVEAIAFLTFAAEKGDVDAQYELGKLYNERKNYERAARFWCAAANQGNKDARYEYGIMRLKGLGVPVSLSSAHYYLDLAAKQGHVRARLRLMFLPKPVSDMEGRSS